MLKSLPFKHALIAALFWANKPKDKKQKEIRVKYIFFIIYNFLI